MKKKKLNSKNTTTLTQRGAESLFRALASPSEPNAALKKAFVQYKKVVKKKDNPEPSSASRKALKARFEKQNENVPGLRNMFRIIQQWALEKHHLEFVAEKFKLTKKQTAVIAGISTRTLQRWKPSTKLSPLIAESIFKLADVYDSGLMVFNDDEESFRAWMRVSVPALDNKRPIDLLDTRTGMELIIEELLRMEYGII